LLYEEVTLRRVASALVAIALCWGLGAAEEGSAEPAGGSGARAAIQALLDRRARAFVERDEAAFMATVGRADPGFYRRQKRMFRWAAAVPFGSYRLVARWDRHGDLARVSDVGRYSGADAVSIPLTEERYRIAGFDRHAAVGDAFFTFARHDGAWRIVDDSGLEHVGLPSARHLWDFGPVTIARSPHFLLLRHRCDSRIDCPPSTGDILALAEQALGRVESLWDVPWRKSVVVVAPTTTAELARMLQTTFDLDNFVAFAASSVDVERGFSYGGHRVLFNPESITNRSSTDVLQILTHELVHVATRPASGPFVPVYIDEGVAEQVAHESSPDALEFLGTVVSRGEFDRRLPTDVEFLTGSADDIYTSYQEAQSAVRFFVDRWGFDRLEDFYVRLGRPAVAAGTAGYHVDRALRATVGVSAAEFERAWARSLE
jgi:hypothetical protein